jgi:formamidopyrimidine-DNA glycosylase
MPELPEVETTLRGLQPHLLGQRIHGVILRRPDLRWPIPAELERYLPGSTITGLRRRAKYLLIDTDGGGSALLHLGMSGSLRVLPGDVPVSLHDHVDICLQNAKVLRFTDPRRFGCLLWQAAGQLHPLLAELGPEPLSAAFSGAYLYRLSRGRKVPVKSWLMDQRTVVGVGNIYAAESLFAAGIHPLLEAGKVSLQRYRRLELAVKTVLGYAIERGGTTLRDFISPDGRPGYFEQELQVYGRDGGTCRRCGSVLKHALIAQRATVWCPRCQR